jgi:DNA-binding transcriptional ArsR family regulator
LKKTRKVTRLSSRGDLCNVRCFKQDLVGRIRSELPSDEALTEARVLFAALADRTRLRILHTLSLADELCVCDVAHVLGMSVAATSHHLRRLRELSILKLRNDGKMAYYALANRSVAALAVRALRKEVA